MQISFFQMLKKQAFDKLKRADNPEIDILNNFNDMKDSQLEYVWEKQYVGLDKLATKNNLIKNEFI